MTAPVLSQAGEQIYALLPDYIRADDEATDWMTKRLVGAAASAMDRSVAFITAADPDTSVSGTCELTNPDAIPRPLLPWLGWLVGVDVEPIPVPYAREAVRNAPTTWLRGSRNAIAAVVARTLSNPVPAPRVWANMTGTDPYQITVVTTIAQTPDEVATLLAAWSEKPAGALLDLQVFNGAVIVELETEFAGRTIVDLEAEFASIVDLEAWIPTT